MGTKMDAMEFADKILTCVDCNAEFVFTAGEQFFFHEKQFVNDPKRCKVCKAKKRHSTSTKIFCQTPVRCAEFGILTTVPFKPNRGTPIFCRACFQGQRQIPMAS